MTLWPSGLRRNVKAVVLIGGGSNPLDVIFVRVRDKTFWVQDILTFLFYFITILKNVN